MKKEYLEAVFELLQMSHDMLYADGEWDEWNALFRLREVEEALSDEFVSWHYSSAGNCWLVCKLEAGDVGISFGADNVASKYVKEFFREDNTVKWDGVFTDGYNVAEGERRVKETASIAGIEWNKTISL